MDFNRLKELAKKLGGILVMDGNEPAFVILSHEKYELLEAGEYVPISSNKNSFEKQESNGIDAANYDEKTVEKLNQEIAALKEEIRQKESAELLANPEPVGEFGEAVDLD